MKIIIKAKVNGHNWKIRFVDQNFLPEGVFGITYFARKMIDIRDDLDKENAELTLTHELTHATLTSQGRTYQKTFTREDICEFVAWNIETIKAIKDQIMKERYAKEEKK